MHSPPKPTAVTCVPRGGRTSRAATKSCPGESIPWVRTMRSTFAGTGREGYGDPIEREPDAVARDVAEGVVSITSALAIYGVVLGGGGGVDSARTLTERSALRDARLAAPMTKRETDTSAPGHGLPVCERCDSRGNESKITGFRLRDRLMRELGAVYTTGASTCRARRFVPPVGHCSTSRSRSETTSLSPDTRADMQANANESPAPACQQRRPRRPFACRRAPRRSSFLSRAPQ